MHLEQEQEEPLTTLVEAYRNLARDRRQPFVVLFLDGERNALITHPRTSCGLPRFLFQLFGGGCPFIIERLYPLFRFGKFLGDFAEA